VADPCCFLQIYTVSGCDAGPDLPGFKPPRDSLVPQPYREWIGGPDPGERSAGPLPAHPVRPRCWRFRTPTLSHTAEGIYARCGAAAADRCRFHGSNAREALSVSLQHIPAAQPTGGGIEDVRLWYDAGLSWSDAMDRVDDTYGHYGWVHTINNAAAVALRCSGRPATFSAHHRLCRASGMDTDSNGATAGSVAGVFAGAESIPSHWVDPLEDRFITTAVFG